MFLMEAWRSWRAKRSDYRRRIYRFWDGTRTRGIDPVRVLRELLADQYFRADKHLQWAMDGDHEAIKICLGATRRAFGVQQWSESEEGVSSGLTDPETLALLFAFSAHLIGVQASSDPPTAAPATAATQ